MNIRPAEVKPLGESVHRGLAIAVFTLVRSLRVVYVEKLVKVGLYFF